MFTAPLAQFANPEAQVCVRCGARYGQCASTETPKPVSLNNRANKRPPAWTEGEDDLLFELYCANGVSITGIANRLARSRSAVLTRLQRHGLRKADHGAEQ